MRGNESARFHEEIKNRRLKKAYKNPQNYIKEVRNYIKVDLKSINLS